MGLLDFKSGTMSTLANVCIYIIIHTLVFQDPTGSEIQKHARTRDVYRNECKTSSEEDAKEEATKEITINVAQMF